jgi:hypothetical protein
MISTIHGMLPEDQLEKRVIRQLDSAEVTNVFATEYWLDGELVHRSITAELVGRDLSGVQQQLA